MPSCSSKCARLSSVNGSAADNAYKDNYVVIMHSDLHAIKSCPHCGIVPGRPHRRDCAIAECRRRGWFAVRSPDGGVGYAPCSPSTPGAAEDLNRWHCYAVTGKDDLYARAAI